jgi:hypothetical protein
MWIASVNIYPPLVQAFQENIFYRTRLMSVWDLTLGSPGTRKVRTSHFKPKNKQTVRVGAFIWRSYLTLIMEGNCVHLLAIMRRHNTAGSWGPPVLRWTIWIQLRMRVPVSHGVWLSWITEFKSMSTVLTHVHLCMSSVKDFCSSFQCAVFSPCFCASAEG